MKRLTAMTLVTVLLLVLLSGCGGGSLAGCTPGSIGGFDQMGRYYGGYCTWSF